MPVEFFSILFIDYYPLAINLRLQSWPSHSSALSLAALIDASLIAEISFWIIDPIGSVWKGYGLAGLSTSSVMVT